MDKITDRETHDLMNVESFSQLPFIRSAPPIKEKGIRLFGIEFGTATTDDSDSPETTNNNNNAFETESTTTTNNKDDNNNNINNSNSTENNVESNRRFECHYCCRNFPTSQALGGHQNAHKRERQHAKRAHLQSTMVHATSFSSNPHLYHHHSPFLNYRFTSPSSSSSTTTYPTWNSNNSSNSLLTGSAARFYGNHSHAHLPSSYSQSHHHHQQQQQQPINGSPLAFWRIPNGVVQSNSNPSFNNHERSLQPLLAVDERNSSFSQVGPSASQNRYVYESKRSVDHVSLDLHL